MVQIRKILCPVDFFPLSETALSYSASLAKNYEAMTAHCLIHRQLRGESREERKYDKHPSRCRVALFAFAQLTICGDRPLHSLSF